MAPAGGQTEDKVPTTIEELLAAIRKTFPPDSKFLIDQPPSEEDHDPLAGYTPDQREAILRQQSRAQSWKWGVVVMAIPDATEWLSEFLSLGPRWRTEVSQAAKDAGITQSRYLRALGVTRHSAQVIGDGFYRYSDPYHLRYDFGWLLLLLCVGPPEGAAVEPSR